jgi:predicted DnaQ family exonuclease/DinG family helicase
LRRLFKKLKLDGSAIVIADTENESSGFVIFDCPDTLIKTLPPPVPDLAAFGTLVLWDSDSKTVDAVRRLLQAPSEWAPAVWDVQEIFSVAVPYASDTSFSTARSILLSREFKDRHPAQQLRWMLISLIEALARLELTKIALMARWIDQSPSNLRMLFRALQEFLKNAPSLEFSRPPLVMPPLPSNCIGELAGRSRDTVEEFVERVFAPNGLLSGRFETYEVRKEQTKLALEIGKSFREQGFIVAEAGTGTGKSLAYLVPAIHHAASGETDGPIVISTHTRNLQDQLFLKDIPLLQQCLPIGFKAALLKGRSNYLCGRKWKAVQLDPAAFLTPGERERTLPLLVWADLTRTGDIMECSAFAVDQNGSTWAKLCSESAYCQAQKCHQSDNCFVKLIREKGQRAHIVVINHALLFSDLMSEGAVLGNYGGLIVDEAHTLERIAQEHLGAEFSMWVVRAMIARIQEKEPVETGLLVRLRKGLARASLTDLAREALLAGVQRAGEACTNLWESTLQYMRHLTIEAHRIAGLHGAQESRNGSTRIRYSAETNAMDQNCPEAVTFRTAVATLCETLVELWTHLQNLSSADFTEADEYRVLLDARIGEWRQLTETLYLLGDPGQPDHVYWFELPARERSLDIRFYAVPLDVAGVLHRTLFDRLPTCVFTSATLSVNGDFEYYKGRVGIDRTEPERVRDCIARSSFDYREQCRILVAAYLPDPQHELFRRSAVDLTAELIRTLRRGTLVLFTSYQMMHAFYRTLEAAFRDAEVTLLMQGKDGSRTSLTERFRRDTTSVLLGTESFWEGVDVPGTALELLVITKLPFGVPTDPLVAAQMERVALRGGNAFYEYAVPEAVTRFRQGFGRLIRSRQDRGVAVVLDNRLYTKSYGPVFLEALPTEAERCQSSDELLRSATSFLAGSNRVGG